ncbi:two-component system response regulator [Nonlabens tegetincola]|uniref:Two-component system response regulator n=1 Tax=Nonlabens tegetincola TaxID=323273 RepID=A0A090PZT2_9FLAO|nr:LytTR family DNA-binding domain-containing protein [Nonlabens tegetincola]GAK96290.1 two-component system response regulator [Nonlabens tegetincola]
MKAIIIDDERKSRNVLKILIEENCPKITEIFQAENLLSGIELIKEHNPRLVFLDIEMPEHSGIEILDFIDKDSYNFEIIFTTAYSEYAIKAFQLAAIDYLLKPVTAAVVSNAVVKALNYLTNSNIHKRLEELKTSLKKDNFSKIGLPYSNGIKFVEFKEIVAFKASGMYTETYLIDGSKILVSKPLKHFTELLKNVTYFFKCHRSYFINIQHIVEYSRSDGGFITLSNTLSVPISNDRKEDFLSIVSAL